MNTHPSHPPAADDQGTARPELRLDDVLITGELARRPSGSPDHAAENEALLALADVMADSPHGVLQALADAALGLCRADSAGISIAESEGGRDLFRWRATAGEFAPYLGGTMPRDSSPCGAVLDRDATLLMAEPARHFPRVAELEPPVREVLLVPFYRGGVAIGTIWAVAHAGDRKFDAEDARLLTRLSRFASAAMQTLANLESIEAAGREVAALHAERERADAALREGGRLLSLIYDNSSDCLYLAQVEAGESYRFVSVNETFLRVSGYSRAQVISRSMEDVVPEGNHDLVRSKYREVVETRRPVVYLEAADLPAGRRHAEITLTPILEGDGPVTHILGTIKDVTVDKRAEEALREREAWLRHAQKAGGIGTFSFDVASGLSTGSEVFLSLFDVPPGLPSFSWDLWEKVVHPDDRDRVIGEIAACLASRESDACDGEYRIVRPDGSVRWVSYAGQVLRDGAGRASRIVGTVSDVTDRKRAEEVLARDALLLANVRDSVVVTDLDGIVTYWNEGATRLFGWTDAEMLGRPYVERFPDLRVRESVAENIRSIAEGSEWLLEWEDYRKDGSRVWIDARVSPVNDAEGRPVGILGLAHDITDRKRAEEGLKEADRRKDEFLALLAHELRNPLAPLRNGLQVMRLAPGDAEATAQARGMMERQLGHMVRLIDDLLDVSRIGRDKMELRRSRVPLSEVVDNALETARPLIEAAGHVLTVSLPAGPVWLDADLTRLAQVLSNLLLNSAKYTERGGRIWLDAARLGGEVAISVRDTGIGIPDDELPRIFDMFSQVDRSIERTTGGLGIGLALVKGLVEMHGGAVTAESGGPGRGSTFTVRLPVTGEVPEAIPAAPSGGGRSAARSGRKILVVDDSLDSARSLAKLLTLLGNEVVTAHDGIAAVEAAEAFRPDVILMDVGMPRLNGYDATRRIRERPWGRSVTVIALTGWGQDDHRVQSREAGCDGHLVKPVDLPDLEKILAQLTGDGGARDRANQSG